MTLTRSIYKTAIELVNEYGLVVDSSQLKNIIAERVKTMDSLDKDYFDDFEGPCPLSKNISPIANLFNLCDQYLGYELCPPIIGALYFLSAVKNDTRRYLYYDEAKKEAVYSESAVVNYKTVRAFAQARSHYWFMKNTAAQSGLELLGLPIKSLTPTKEELSATQEALEEIADALLLPGVLQSQKGWSKRGAKDALSHAPSQMNYSANFSGAGLSEADWSFIESGAWPILLQAALYRPLFDDASVAYQMAEAEALRGYLCGTPSAEFVLLKENKLRKLYPSTKKKVAVNTGLEPIDDLGVSLDLHAYRYGAVGSVYNLRQKLISLFCPDHADT